nr:MG2 domain-containing protein [uncultured Capnocytophaga sp.]
MRKLYVLCMLFLALVGCKKDKNFNSNPLEFREYISGYTSGLISSRSGFNILLNKSVTQEKMDKINDLGLFEISPNVSGKVVCVNPTQVAFVPDKPLEQDTEYRVSFALKKLFEVDKSNLNHFNFTVRTLQQAFRVTANDLQSYNENLYFLNAELQANDQIDYQTAKDIFKATVDGKKVAVKFQTQGTNNKFLVVFDSIPRVDKDQTLEIKWDTNQAPRENLIPFSFEIPQKGVFKPLFAENNGSNNEFYVNFSDPLDKEQDFNGMVTLSKTDTQLKYSVNGNVLKMFRDEKKEGDYVVYVREGVKNVYGQALTKDYQFGLRFNQQRPDFHFLKSGTLLPSSENLKINFQTINLRAINVTVYRIYENNILQFLQENDLGGGYYIRRVARPVARKVLKLTEGALYPLDDWNTYSLDLASVITPEPGAIYRVELGMTKNYSLYTCGSKNEEPLDLSFEEKSLDEDEPTEGYDEEEYYSYEESEDPCNDYYYYGRTISTNVLATDLGVIVKRGQNNRYTIAVNNLLTTEPVKGAMVEVFNYQQQKIQEGKTDGNGFITMDIGSTAYFAKVKKDNYTTYVKMDQYASQSLSKYDVDGLVLQKGLNGYIYTERGVWRPGDSIHIGFILNDFSQKNPEKLPIKLRFTDPYGKVIAERMQIGNASNHYTFALKTAADAPTGNWNVSISAGAAKFGKRIKIETIKPNRLKIENSLEGKVIGAAGSNAQLNVQWLQGTPAGNTEVSVKAKFLPTTTTFKGYESYLFDNKANDFESDEINVFEGKTNADGNANFYFKTNELRAPGMLKVNFLTQANESGGDFSTDVASASFSPYKEYVGLKMPNVNKYDYLSTDEDQDFRVVVLSENGKPLAGKGVTATIYRVSWSWWWDATNQNISTYNSSNSSSVYAVKSLTTDSSGKAHFTLKIDDDDWGRYFILLTNNDSGHRCGTTAYFDWGSWEGKSRRTESNDAVMLTLGTDKKEYNVGDKAVISFPSDKGGRALISVENGSAVLDTYWVETAAGETTYKVPITDKMTPNVYFYVTLLQPHANTANDAPIRLYGVVPVNVKDKNTELNPVIQAPEKFVPQKKATIKVSEKDGKPMTYTLAIVEDGLLNLTRFRTPNPHKNFFVKTALGVKTWDVYDNVIGAYGGTINQAFSIGGDEDLGGAEAQKANRFKPFVIFKGPFELKKGSSNTHEVQIPNYMGSARVMVVASNVEKNAYGFAEKKNVPVISPVSLLGSLPRKAVPGEKVVLPVTVFAMEKQVKNVSVSVETNGQFKVVGNRTQSLSFNGIGEQMAYFELETTQHTGIGKVKLTATSGNEKATYEVEMDVYNPNPTTYVVENAVIGAGKSVSVNASVLGNNAKTTLEISSFPGVNLSSRLNYLIGYPHGCAEQVTSGAFPQLFLADFVTLTKEKAEETNRNVNAAISKLHENQLSNGGFTYWKGGRYADDWVTSYIGQFYIEAEKKGYVLPPNSKQKWLDYQNTEARQWRFEGQYQNDFAQAYRLYTLALAGSPNIGAMNRLRELKDITPNAKRTLAAAYALAGQKQTAAKLFQTTALDEDNGYYYGSVLRNKAMAMETALLIGHKQDAARWALEIADKLSSNDWLSTQSTAYALYAMAKYVAVNKSGKNFTASYTFNGKTETINSGESMVQVPLKVNGQAAVQVKNTSGQTLYVRLISSGVLPVGKELVMQNGVAISTTFRDNKGQTIDVSTLRQSTEFVAAIQLTNLTNERVENIALTQIIPSGWEIINTRFTDYGDASDNAAIDYADFRDDRANYYLSLSANQSKTIRLKLNASYAGKYYLPGTYAEAMYNNRYNTRTNGKWVEVVKK